MAIDRVYRYTGKTACSTTFLKDEVKILKMPRASNKCKLANLVMA